MKVLFLSSKDATNFRIVNIIKQFIIKGHEVFLYPLITDFQHIRMFKNISELKWIDTLDYNTSKNFDCFFCANDTVWRVIEYNKYIFTFNCLTLGNAMSEGADFMFIPGNTNRYEYKEKCAFMKIGNPIYDDYNECITVNNNKNFLFIDSGHYPFGLEGKRILANLLLEICDKFPDYTLTVKPRTLISDVNPTHINKNDLYSNIISLRSELPHNLIYLDYHENMKSLISKCDTVICMYTSAWLDAAVAGKGLIIVDGLPNEDSKDLNNKLHWHEARKSMIGTNCLVHYNDVLQFLPDGKKCSEEQLNIELKYREDCSAKIVKVVEKIIDKSNDNMFLKQGEYSFDSFDTEIVIAETIDLKMIHSNRVFNRIMNIITRFRDCMDRDISVEDVIDELNIINSKGMLTIDNLYEIDKYFWDFFEKLIIKQIDKYLANEIAISYILPILFRHNQQDAFDLLNKIEFINRVTDYYNARRLENCGSYIEAIELYKHYIKEYNSIAFEKFYTDNHDIYVSSLFHIGNCMFQCQKYKEALYYYDLCNKEENGKHFEARKKIFHIKRYYID